MAQVIWSKLAEDQLHRAVLYIRDDQGLFYARLVLNQILEAVDVLETHPKSGPREPLLRHRKYEYRYIVVWSYKIVYRIVGSRVAIARVFHTAQRPTKLVRPSKPKRGTN